MMLESLLETVGTDALLAIAGALTGIIFGMSAQHSRFCLRAAVVELADFKAGNRFAIWLIAFCVAVISTNLAIELGVLSVSDARQLATVGSMSGAIIGGLMFGAGMILARGCASRLLVLSATGNLRALLTGLVVTLVAQASLGGILSGPRQYLSQLWLVDAGASRSLLSILGIDALTATLLTGLLLVPAYYLVKRYKIQYGHVVAGGIVGLAVAFGWIATYQISQVSFDIVPVSSITFTGPATDTLMVVATQADFPLNFGIGLVIGVFFGSAAMSFAAGEFRIERFTSDTPMERYLIGAVLMGFGAMLAGGCAVGAGVTGSAIFALTAWTAIFFMWVGAAFTHVLMKEKHPNTMTGAELVK